MISRRSWSASWALSRMTCGGPADLGGGGVRPEFERPGVHAEQGQPVGQYVVHLAGDGLPGQALGLFGAQLRLGLGAAGPFAEREDELAPGAYDHAPAEHQQDQQDPDDDRGEKARRGVGAQEGLQGSRDQRARADDRHRLERAVHGETEEGHHQGPGGHGFDDADDGQHGGEPDGPASSEPERAAGRRSDHRVDEDEDVRRGVVGVDRGERQQADAAWRRERP